jgi:putative DNA methylase
MAASDDPEKDRGIFLKLLTMDREGLRQRKLKSIPETRLVAELLKLPPSVQRKYLLPSSDHGEQSEGRPTLSKLSNSEKGELQDLVFERLSYAEKIQYCDRPEQIDGPSIAAWSEINAHIGTNARCLTELVQELGKRRFGRPPRVGDAFCGGGSIPFEAARLGCDVYGSDLNPVAALLTWASLNIVGGGPDVIERVEKARCHIYDLVDKQVIKWGIEQNSLVWRADAYLYCAEVTDPESGWKVPLLPSMIIGRKRNTIARLTPDIEHCRFDIDVLEDVSDEEMVAADLYATDRDSRVYIPGNSHGTPIDIVRQGIRQWGSKDITPREDDVFQERLYCIRWIEDVVGANGKIRKIKHYRAPTFEDQKREERVLSLLLERFDDWQREGYLPSWKIEPGAKTDEPVRTRGWTYWHHLFTPRQLLILGLLSEKLELITRLLCFNIRMTEHYDGRATCCLAKR